MSHLLEPLSNLSALGPVLPGGPDRLLRSRWLAATDGFSAAANTITTTTTFLTGITESQE